MRKVLIVGEGAREHALAWKLSLSPEVGHIILTPGNDGIEASLQVERWATHRSLAVRAKECGVDLAVVGPDNPLAEGIVDEFSAAGVLAFGPDKAAARIEASKAFAKDVMSAARVSTAEYRVFDVLDEAIRFLRFITWNRGWVLKADGLAFGKGVSVCDTKEEAIAHAPALFEISKRLVIEERLLGKEISCMAFCDGEHFSLMEPARDYKRLRDNGFGPNTGGMGAFSPVEGFSSESFMERLESEVFAPVLREMKSRGCPFKGVLYAGLMLDPESDRFWVLEFNARFGDPEAQVLLPRMEGDLYEWCLACAQGDLSRFPRRVPFKKDTAVYVVAAAPGYPERPEKEISVTGPLTERDEGGAPRYFLAGLKKNPAGFVTSGGRVFGALGIGADCRQARAQAYERLSAVRFQGVQYRTDIAS